MPSHIVERLSYSQIHLRNHFEIFNACVNGVMRDAGNQTFLSGDQNMDEAFISQQ
jgi:hypothetical protein